MTCMLRRNRAMRRDWLALLALASLAFVVACATAPEPSHTAGTESGSISRAARRQRGGKSKRPTWFMRRAPL